jgi:hypothetical protein
MIQPGSTGLLPDGFSPLWPTSGTRSLALAVPTDRDAKDSIR